MRTTYLDDDILVIRLSDKPVVREVSQDWRTQISFAADGSIVETVILEARESGAWPLRVERRQAAWFRVWLLNAAAAPEGWRGAVTAGGVLLACGRRGQGNGVAPG
jgi:hypothetical protein